VNCLRGVFGSGSVRSGRSRASWSKYFAAISDSRSSGINRGESDCENRSKSGRIIITIVFRLLICCFSSHSITGSLLVISA
jgi:hypothetical protein